MVTSSSPHPSRPADRELLVLRVAHVRGCEYEWAQHTVLARDAGLDVADIERVASGPDAEGWSEPERALLRAVDELVEGAGLSEGTWASLNETSRCARCWTSSSPSALTTPWPWPFDPLASRSTPISQGTSSSCDGI